MLPNAIKQYGVTMSILFTLCVTVHTLNTYKRLLVIYENHPTHDSLNYFNRKRHTEQTAWRFSILCNNLPMQISHYNKD